MRFETWRLLAVLVLGTIAAHPSRLAAQSMVAAPRGIDPERVADDQEIDDGVEELGAALGIEGGGGESPGGLHFSATYLSRLVGNEWLDASFSVTAGAGDAVCFRDRSNSRRCELSIFGGSAVEASLSFRHYFLGPSRLRPFGKLGVGFRMLSIRGDGIRGIGLPLLVGGGVRSRVAKRTVFVAQALLRTGPGVWGDSLGTNLQRSLAFTAGVEFNLD